MDLIFVLHVLTDIAKTKNRKLFCSLINLAMLVILYGELG